MKGKVISLTIPMISFLYFILGLTAYNSYFAWMNTTYANGFSPEKFHQIRSGMTKEEVETLLGEPLTIRVSLLEEHDYGLPRSYRYIFYILPDNYFVYESYRITFYTSEWVDQENQRRRLNKQGELENIQPDTVHSISRYWFNE